MPVSNTLVSLLIQFRWSLLFIVLLSLGHLPISPFSKSTAYGSYEQFVNNVVFPVVYTFLQVAPFLFLLSSLEALFGPSIRWIWNRRLADRVQFLQRRGMHARARQLADRRLSSTRWTAIVFTILALTAVLVSVGYWSEVKTPPRWQAVHGVADIQPVFSNPQSFLIASILFVFVLCIERLLSYVNFLWESSDDPDQLLEGMSAEGSEKN
jgi:hypothetical protein